MSEIINRFFCPTLDIVTGFFKFRFFKFCPFNSYLSNFVMQNLIGRKDVISVSVVP